MNLTKNQWIIIAVVAAIAVWYFFLRKKDAKENGYVGQGLGPRATVYRRNPEESGLTAGTICSKKCYAGWGWYCCGGTEAQKGKTATATN